MQKRKKLHIELLFSHYSVSTILSCVQLPCLLSNPIYLTISYKDF